MNIYSNSKKMIFHNGWWHGSNAAFIRLVQDTATIIVIGNKFNRGIYHSKNLANIFSNYFAATDNMEESEGMKINDSIPFQNDESETGNGRLDGVAGGCFLRRNRHMMTARGIQNITISRALKAEGRWGQVAEIAR